MRSIYLASSGVMNVQGWPHAPLCPATSTSDVAGGGPVSTCTASVAAAAAAGVLGLGAWSRRAWIACIAVTP